LVLVKKLRMISDIDKEFAHVITETLKAVLSPDKALIDQAQMQLKVLQVRQGLIFLLSLCFFRKKLPLTITFVSK
jgi:hypothetical protein